MRCRFPSSAASAAPPCGARLNRSRLVATTTTTTTSEAARRRASARAAAAANSGGGGGDTAPPPPAAAAAAAAAAPPPPPAAEAAAPPSPPPSLPLPPPPYSVLELEIDSVLERELAAVAQTAARSSSEEEEGEEEHAGAAAGLEDEARRRAPSAASSSSASAALVRKTKLVCTIGPASCSYEALARLAEGGMSVARLNMCHGDAAWHGATIAAIRQVNRDLGTSVAVMVDTEGSEVHTGELDTPIELEEGAAVCLTVRQPPVVPSSLMDGAPVIPVSRYETLVDELLPGDSVVVDGGMVELVVESRAGPDVRCTALERGLILSRAGLTFRRHGELIRGRSDLLPVITSKDWSDIDFALSAGVDFIAVSFVRSADVLQSLRSYAAARCAALGGVAPPELIAKVEALDCLRNLDAVIAASDGVMVARGDLGAQISVEDVPAVQKAIVLRARQLGKPCIVAHDLLRSMISLPIPTRAEVADVADAVRQRADALMLSGESAVGIYGPKALGVLRGVARRMEARVAEDKGALGAPALPQIGANSDGRVSEELCASAALMANSLRCAAVFVYTRRGYMASFLSRCRPDPPIYAFTDDAAVRRRLALRWGVVPLLMRFEAEPEANVRRSFEALRARGLLSSGDLVVVVSDLRPEQDNIIRSVQVRRVP
jgi:pyruvate kinase